MDKDEIYINIHLDFSKAFNTIDQTILIIKILWCTWNTSQLNQQLPIAMVNNTRTFTISNQVCYQQQQVYNKVQS